MRGILAQCRSYIKYMMTSHLQINLMFQKPYIKKHEEFQNIYHDMTNFTKNNSTLKSYHI